MTAIDMNQREQSSELDQIIRAFPSTIVSEKRKVVYYKMQCTMDEKKSTLISLPESGYVVLESILFVLFKPS